MELQTEQHRELQYLVINLSPWWIISVAQKSARTYILCNGLSRALSFSMWLCLYLSLRALFLSFSCPFGTVTFRRRTDVSRSKSIRLLFDSFGTASRLSLRLNQVQTSAFYTLVKTAQWQTIPISWIRSASIRLNLRIRENLGLCWGFGTAFLLW